MKTLPDLKSFCGHAPTGPTYTDLAREVDRLRKERDAIMGSLIEAARFEMEWAFQDGNTPGYNARKARNYGDRANEYRLRAEDAERELESLRKQVEALKQGQRSASEARQRAFLELAEDLAAMTPEKRDAAIKRIIDNAGENRP